MEKIFKKEIKPTEEGSETQTVRRWTPVMWQVIRPKYFDVQKRKQVVLS